MKPLWLCLLVFLCTTATAAPSLPLALDERRLLPVVTHSMTPGSVSPRALSLPGMTPLFLVGDDPHSRRWLIDNRQRLVRLHAAGLVVNVKTMEGLQALRRLAPGLTLIPASADDIARRLSLSHYPVLLTEQGLEP